MCLKPFGSNRCSAQIGIDNRLPEKHMQKKKRNQRQIQIFMEWENSF